MIKKREIVTVVAVVLLLGGGGLQASLVDFLSTPDTSGLISGNDGWGPNEDGFRVTWTISQNPDLTWHYKYEFTKADGTALEKLTSHFIISLSDDIQETDLFNFTVDSNADEIEFGTFGPASGNPGFPSGKSIFGVKIGLHNDQTVAEFDSNRQPMWGDFYAKDGVTEGLWNYAYNTDIGVTVANLLDYLTAPVDVSGGALHKVLVPDTIIPEPATICLLGLGSLALRRKRRA